MYNAWKITGIPCKHAVRAILHSSQDPIRFCSDWYSCKMYKQAYASIIRSIPDPEHWPEMQFPLIKPPMMKRVIERPIKNKKRKADEEQKGKKSKTVKCSICKEFGHNVKTCNGGLTAKQKKGKRTISTRSSSKAS
ncbi:uncharacterized protein LOC130823198 [Amaranthus tricolor]|uniref:uncharacterized protein LOC130823198 n=1 Tax=Amaranthus tricolor TaxID=29722 RepID=UPI00258A098D|nr:uncharacterized protein LOC130823198 [Amaranthus tricolor]